MAPELTYQLITVDGRRMALWSDGRIHPLVYGGDGDDAGGQGGDPGGDDSSGGDDGKGDDTGGGDDDGKDGAESQPDTLTMTQAQFDKRMARARKQWEKEATTKAEREKMDEAARLKAEKEDAEKTAGEKVSSANRKVITAEAKVAAVAAGVKPDRLAKFLRIVDLDDIDLDDDGEFDEAEVKTAVSKALEDMPEFKGGTAGGPGGASGSDHNGDSKPTQLSREQLKSMTPAEIVEAKKEGRLASLLGQ